MIIFMAGVAGAVLGWFACSLCVVSSDSYKADEFNRIITGRDRELRELQEEIKRLKDINCRQSRTIQYERSRKLTNF